MTPVGSWGEEDAEMANLTKTYEDKDVVVYHGNTGGVLHTVIEGYHAPDQTTYVDKHTGERYTAVGPHSEEKASHNYATGKSDK